jgi:hypothetical protein
MKNFFTYVGIAVTVLAIFACAFVSAWTYNYLKGTNQLQRVETFVVTLEAIEAPVQNSVIIQPEAAPVAQPTAVILNLVPEQPTAVPVEEAEPAVGPQEPEAIIDWQQVIEATAVPDRQLTPEQEAACAQAKAEGRRQAPYCANAQGGFGR